MTLDGLIARLEEIKKENGGDTTVLVSINDGRYSYHHHFNGDDVVVYYSSGKPSKFVAINA